MKIIDRVLIILQSVSPTNTENLNVIKPRSKFEVHSFAFRAFLSGSLTKRVHTPGPSYQGKPTKAEILHRHYGNVLLDAIKRRCSNVQELIQTQKKLNEFFSALRFIHRLYLHHLAARSQSTTGEIKGGSRGALQRMSIQEILRCHDAEDEDINDGLNCLSPMNIHCRTRLYWCIFSEGLTFEPYRGSGWHFERVSLDHLN